MADYTLTHTGAELDAAITKVEGDYRDCSGVNAAAGDVRQGKKIMTLSGEVIGTYATSLQNKSVTPSASQQSVTADSGYDGLGTVTVTAVPTGMAGTPTASKGDVSGHSIDITPTVTNVAGYITGGTKTGTAVTVSASELVSGTKTITENGTQDVTNYESVNVNVSGGTVTDEPITITENGVTNVPSGKRYTPITVNVPSSEPVLQDKTVNPFVYQQIVRADSGYDGLGTVTVNALQRGTPGTPAASKSVSGNTATVTPSVTNETGFISGGTITGTAVTVSASELVSGTKTITENGTHDVTDYASVNVNVQGGGGVPLPATITAGDTPVVMASEVHASCYSTSWTNMMSMTIRKAGTYRIKCYGHSYTSNTRYAGYFQLYQNGTAIGQQYQLPQSSSAWNNDLDVNVSCAAGDTLEIRGKAYSSSTPITVVGFCACINWDNTF